MLPIYIYKIKSIKEETMCIKPSWVKDLPEVVGEWGFGKLIKVDSHVAICKNGGMDETFFNKTTSFYKSLHPNVAPGF